METESLKTLKAEVEKCQNDLGGWKKYADLENQTQNLCSEMKNEINTLEEEISEFQHVSKKLTKYDEDLEEMESRRREGKNNQIGKKQQLTKIQHRLKNKAQCALWFCKSYGLELNL